MVTHQKIRLLIATVAAAVVLVAAVVVVAVIAAVGCYCDTNPKPLPEQTAKM